MSKNIKLKTSRHTLIEELADVSMNSLIILSFLKILLVQGFFIVNNTWFFVATIIFMILLLLDPISVMLRTIVSTVSLYIFLKGTAEGASFSTYIIPLIITYFGLYIIFRKIVFRKNIEFEVVSNCLALAIFIKLLYSHLMQINRYFPQNTAFITSIIVIIILLIPVFEDIGRFVISSCAAIEVMYSLLKLSSLFTVAVLLIVIIIFGSLNYRIRKNRNKKSEN